MRNIIEVTVPACESKRSAHPRKCSTEFRILGRRVSCPAKRGTTLPVFVTNSLIRDKAAPPAATLAFPLTSSSRNTFETRYDPRKTGCCLRSNRPEWLLGNGIAKPDAVIVKATLKSFSASLLSTKPVFWFPMTVCVSKAPSQPLSPVIRTGVIKDITSQIDSEAAAQQAALRLQVALEAAELGIWDLDLQTLIAKCSARHYQLVGYEPGPSSGSDSRFLAHVHPE